MPSDDSQSRRAFASVAFALAGFGFALTPIAERIDAWWLDHQWGIVRLLGARTLPDQIAIVGVDEESVRRTPQLLGTAHEALGDVLGRVAGAHPRAIALDLPLPDRSFEPPAPVSTKRSRGASRPRAPTGRWSRPS